MKKIMFVALALLIGLASCVKDKQYSGIKISNVTYAPNPATEEDDVTVSATITCLKAFTAQLYYAVNDGKTTSLAMTETEGIYTAVIPAQPLGTKVKFHVEAENDELNVVSSETEYEVVEGGITPPTPNADYRNLVLNELNGDTKFIEFYNKGDLDLSMEGMYIMKDDYVAGATWTADASVVVPAHGYVLLYSEDVVAEGQAQVGYPENLVFHSGFSGKKTVRITLFMPDGTVRDEYTRGSTGEWGQNISNVGAQSFARTPDGGDWKLADPTPGEANPATGDDIPQE